MQTTVAQAIAVRMVPVSTARAVVTTSGEALIAPLKSFVQTIAFSVVLVTMGLVYTISDGVARTVAF